MTEMTELRHSYQQISPNDNNMDDMDDIDDIDEDDFESFDRIEQGSNNRSVQNSSFQRLNSSYHYCSSFINYYKYFIIGIFSIVLLLVIKSSIKNKSSSSVSDPSSSSSDNNNFPPGYIKPLNPVSIEIPDNKFFKPLSDNREYHGFTLPNHLEVLLISDPLTDKSSASLSVGVGSWSDGEIFGLAHFTEHCVFMGSEKYPNENEYSDYLSKHSGLSNAYTAEDKTVFYFDIETNYLSPMLDRFAQFFTSPLLLKDSIQREMLAVNNEHEKNLQSDEWRIYELFKTHANKLHPYSQFGTGNLLTLNRTDIHKALINFHHKHYVPQNMKLVLLGIETITELKSMVIEYFNDIEDRPYLSNSFNNSVEVFPMTNEYRPRQVYVKPIADQHSLIVYFPLQSSLTLDYFSSPLSFISSLIGDESEGSIISILKSKQWANTLSVSLMEDEVNLNVLQIAIRLTPLGLFHWQAVLGEIEGFIDLIQKEDSTSLKTRWDEWKRVSELNYHLSERISSIDYTSMLAARLITVALNDVLLSPEKYLYDSKSLLCLIEEELQINNGIIFLISSSFQNKIFSSIEPVYGTHYSSLTMPQSLIDAIQRDAIKDITVDNDNNNNNINKTISSSSTDVNNSAEFVLSLPERNEFLPSTKPSEMLTKEFHRKNSIKNQKYLNHPHQLLGSERTNKSSKYQLNITNNNNIKNIELLTQFDSSFHRPRAIVYLNFKLTPELINSLEKITMLEFYVRLIDTNLVMKTYSAQLVGYSYQLSLTSTGLQLITSGLTERLIDYISLILDTMRNDELYNDYLFNSTLSVFNEDLSNLKATLAYQQALYQLQLIINKQSYNNEQKLFITQSLTSENFTHINYNELIFFNSFLTIYSHGEINEKMNLKLTKLFNDSSSSLIMNKNSYDSNLIQLPRGSGDFIVQRSILNTDDKNVAVLIHIPICGWTSMNETILLELLYLSIKQPIFDELRTKQQLGYIALSFITEHELKYRALNIIVQGINHSANDLTQRIIQFLNDFSLSLKSSTDEEFELLKESLIADKIRPNRAMTDVSDPQWSEILSQRYLYDYKEKEILFINNITQQQFQSFYEEKILNIGSRSRLIIQIVQNLQSESIDIENNNDNNVNDKVTVIGDSVEEISSFQSSLDTW